VPVAGGTALPVRPASPPQRALNPNQCQNCFAVAEVKEVVLMQNIGALVVRFHKILRGRLCRECIRENFYKMTAITVLLGWWGVISFFFTLVAIPTNIVQFCRTFGMAPRSAGSSSPNA